jgi:hypothetical protein
MNRLKNLNLSQYLSKHYAIEAYGRVEVEAHSFRTPVPDGGVNPRQLYSRENINQ